MDQQLNHRQFTHEEIENLTAPDDCSSVAARLRRLGPDGFRHGGPVASHGDESFAPSIEEERGEEREEEFAAVEECDFDGARLSEDSAEIAAANARQRDDNVQIDASQMSFFGQMREFLHRNAMWLLVAALVLLILQDVLGMHGVLAMRRSQKEAAAVQKEIQQLNNENQKLQDRVQSLKTDPATIERIAREEMGLARPGEYIFKIQPKPGEPSTPLAQPAEPPKKP